MESAGTRLHRAYSELREFIACILAVLFKPFELVLVDQEIVSNVTSWQFEFVDVDVFSVKDIAVLEEEDDASGNCLFHSSRTAC